MAYQKITETTVWVLNEKPWMTACEKNTFLWSGEEGYSLTFRNG